jgi:hypothetical protein
MDIISTLFEVCAVVLSERKNRKTGTKFKDATRGRVIIERPGYKPSVGHPRKPKR